MIKIDQNIKTNYDKQYSDNTEEWRHIGAIGKVENIQYLSKYIKFENVLDVGAGDGNILALLSQNNFCKEYYAVEISNSAIEQIKKKNINGLKEIKQFDGYKLPFEDKAFDLVICSHVIEHVEFPRQLLREIKRVSKNQILEVPIDFSINVDKKFKHFNAYGHINIYTPNLFNFLLLSEGFNLIKHKNSLYKKEIFKFQYKNNHFKYFQLLTKRFVWLIFPFLMKIKPNTYTILTN